MGWLGKMSTVVNETISSGLNSLAQKLNTNETEIINADVITDEIKSLCRKAAAEGAVLLKNDGTRSLT